MYYVLVQETGEYSSMDYKVIEVHTTMEDALNSKEFYIKRMELKNKIATLYGRFYDHKEYLIFEVNQKEPIVSIKEELQKLEKHYEKKLIEATAWKKEFDLQKEIEKNIRETQEIQSQKEIIDSFMNWWDDKNDPYFEEKKAAKIRELKTVLQPYLLKTNNQNTIKWFKQQNIF